MRVGWFAQTRNANVASVRYRCFHMAWGLHRLAVSSAIFSDAEALRKKLRELDAVVVVKRMDAVVVDVVTAAVDLGKPVFLDICDDVLSLEYRPHMRHLHRAVFGAVLPLVDTIVTTGSAMSERVRSYGFALPELFEIPDVAETRETLAQVTAYAAWLENPAAGLPTPEGGGNGGSEPKAGADESAEVGLGRPRRALADPIGVVRRVRVVWFGNHGAPHGNFGMLSLIAAAPALRSVHAESPLELIVVSNHQAKFDVILSKLGVPVRYVPWTARAVYDELEQADVALLTNGDDSFSAVKSANRALQALACGVPVVASSNAALRELDRCVALDDVAGGLRTYIMDPHAVRAAVAAGQALITERYSTVAIGRRWLGILSRHLDAPSRGSVIPGRPQSPARLLFLIDSLADLQALQPLVEEVRRRGLEVLIMVTSKAGRDFPDVLEYLIREQLIPTMTTTEELASGDARWLRAADTVVLGGEPASAEQSAALALAALARSHGIHVVHASPHADRAAAILDDLVARIANPGLFPR